MLQGNHSNQKLFETLISSNLNDSIEELITCWFNNGILPQSTMNSIALMRFLNTEIARIDDAITQQLNTILHNNEIQKLEAAWRGLKLIINEANTDDGLVKVRLLNISWPEIAKDTKKHDIEQSTLFQKIYDEEFGTAGGEPYGLILVNSSITIQGSKSFKDIDVLSGLAQIASASFCPMIFGVSPNSFQVENFAELNLANNFHSLFKQPEYKRWLQFCTEPDARFIALTLPNVILRQPYKSSSLFENNFHFHEETSKITDYLWGNACFAFGAVCIRSFIDTGWFGDIRGVGNKTNPKGEIDQIPKVKYDSFTLNQSMKMSTNFFVDEADESMFAELGMIAVTQLKEKSYFLSNNSVYMPTTTNQRKKQNANDELASMLQYILCASRFAHYVKIIGRNLIGSLSSPQECQQKLTSWVIEYLATNELDTKYRYKFPLKSAKIEIKDAPGKPGVYHCVMHLQPHYQLEKVNTALTLVTELAEINS